MIQYSDYIAYFETLAVEHTDIRHSTDTPRFFRTSLEEVLASISNNKIRYPAVMLLPMEIRPTGQEDNRYEKMYGGFLILDALRRVGDHNRLQEIQNQTRSIAEDFIQRIKHDIEHCDFPLAEKLFWEFDENEVKKRDWGPVWDNAYGWSYEFPLLAPYHHQYNPQKWLKE